MDSHYDKEHLYDTLPYSSFNRVMREFTAGEFYLLRRCFTLPVEAQENDEYVTDAWFTIKEDPTDADADAFFQKHITATESATDGLIESPTLASPGYQVSLKFYLQGSDTAKLTPESPYYYDIKYRTSANKPYVRERGRLFAYQGVTVAGSN